MPKNQTSFKPGNNANPNGRPKKEWTMSSLYRQALEESGETGEPKKKIIARKLTELAEKGDLTAIKELNNRIDGLPQQSVDVTSNGQSINVQIKDYDGENKSYDYAPAETEDSSQSK